MNILFQMCIGQLLDDGHPIVRVDRPWETEKPVLAPKHTPPVSDEAEHTEGISSFTKSSQHKLAKNELMWYWTCHTIYKRGKP